MAAASAFYPRPAYPNGPSRSFTAPTTSTTDRLTSQPRNADSTARKGLLIPTDRPLDELEAKWLPKLGRLRVEKEVSLQGYALYALRTWYLSRTHWAQTIVTHTGKPNEHITAYLVLPDSELSEKVGQAELDNAIKILVQETQAQRRNTEHGVLLVKTPSAFGQDMFLIPGGDLREMKPYLIVNTGLRRLGCGGRAAMGMDAPNPAVRRKFFELYLIPPTSNTSIAPTSSPTNSPSKRDPPSPSKIATPSPTSPSIANDRFTQILVELVILIQAALSIWGVVSEAMEIDGLFCDETKASMGAWRKIMGVEHEESMRLERETSGGCIDPKTLAALLSSITSVRYQLDALDVEKVPKDPFANPRRFLRAWHAFQSTVRLDTERAEFLTVSSIRALNTHYLHFRTRSTDALKVPKFFLSGVASATSSISANLKGGGQEDTPIRRREHHLWNRIEDGWDETGFSLIVPAGEAGPSASPDIITSDLEAYTRGILKTREKDLDTMGARRIAELWSDHGHGRNGRHRRAHTGVLRRRHDSVEDFDDSVTRGTLGKLGEKTGQVIKDGFGRVSRRATMYETSDSDTGGPGPSSLRSAFTRRRQTNVPTVVEPDVEEVDEQLDHDFNSIASPSTTRLHVNGQSLNNASRKSIMSSTSHGRPSIVTTVSHDSDHSRRSQTVSPLEDRPEFISRHGPDDRALAWRNRGLATAMLRTSSDGADVVVEEGGMEWQVLNPHGTGKGQHGNQPRSPERRHSLQDRIAYRSTRLVSATHLAIDVELCGALLELRVKERELAQKAEESRIIEESIFRATQDLIDAIRSRRDRITHLQHEAEGVEKELRRTVEEIDEDEALQWASKKIQFYLSEDVNTNDIMWNLRDLEKEWDEAREQLEERKRGTEGKRWAFWPW